MRKSLAPVSGSALNSRAAIASRQSLAPVKQTVSNSRSTLGGRSSSIGGRQSLAPSGRYFVYLSSWYAVHSSICFVYRRSTLAASGSAKLEDPRNVKDKSFIRASLQRLIEFLVENNYDRQISQKQLEAPATKDFLHILNFLYNKIDPKFQLGPNIVEEVPLLFKRLRSIHFDCSSH